MAEPLLPKPVIWIGTSRHDFREMPKEVRSHLGYAIYIAQLGAKHRDAKPLKGFSGASVVEVVKDHHGDTFRAVYTVRFADSIYVLHAFQKKSKTGSKTPKAEIKLIQMRLREAERIAKGA
jgi:phage-related protein